MINGVGLMQKVVVIGGKSELALATVKYLPMDSEHEIFLIGKNMNPQNYERILSNSKIIECDLLDEEKLHKILNQIASTSDIDLFILAVGYLGLRPAESSLEDFKKTTDINFSFSAKALWSMKEILFKQKHGRILVFSSVAALKPRSVNYVYGAAKSGLDFLARGIQIELEKETGSITIVRPGFVFTKMTQGMKPAPFAIKSEVLGKIVAEAVMKRKKIVYVPNLLKFVMLIIRILPNSLLSKLN